MFRIKIILDFLRNRLILRAGFAHGLRRPSSLGPLVLMSSLQRAKKGQNERFRNKLWKPVRPERALRCASLTQGKLGRVEWVRANFSNSTRAVFLFIFCADTNLLLPTERDPFCFASQLCATQCIAIGSFDNTLFAVLQLENKIITVKVGDTFCAGTVLGIEQNRVIVQDANKIKVNLNLKTLQLK